jgi:hypothetical protein
MFSSIGLRDSVFESVAVYWNRQSKNPVVTHLLLFVRSDAEVDKDFLKQKLVHALGPPSEPQPGYLEWHLNDGTGVFMSPDGDDRMQGRTYVIMERGFRPGDWPSQTTTGSVKK